MFFLLLLLETSSSRDGVIEEKDGKKKHRSRCLCGPLFRRLLACQSQERALRDALEALAEEEERAEEAMMENGREEEKVEGKRTFDRWRGRAGHRCDACFFSRSFPFPSLPAPSRPDSDHSAPHGHADERSSRARAVARAKKAEKDRKKQGQKNERRKKLTCTSLVVPGSTIPLDGRTANFFGAVVLSLKATRSEPGLWRLSVAVTFLRSSKRKRSSDARKRWWRRWGWGVSKGRGRGFFEGARLSLSLSPSLSLLCFSAPGERERHGGANLYLGPAGGAPRPP